MIKRLKNTIYLKSVFPNRSWLNCWEGAGYLTSLQDKLASMESKAPKEESEYDQCATTGVSFDTDMFQAGDALETPDEVLGVIASIDGNKLTLEDGTEIFM